MSSEESTSPGGHSVTRLIARLKQADAQAADQIWRRFFERLLPLARARLRGLHDRSADEEDLLVSVFDRFFRAVREDRFARLADRDDLWQILMLLVEHKVTEQFRMTHAQKRGGGQVWNSSDLSDEGRTLQDLVDREPAPELVASFNDQLARALTGLDGESVRRVALLKLEGRENVEIARMLDISLSSVERKLRVIREAWESQFGA